LRHHFTTKHAILKDKHVDFFRGNFNLKQRKSTIRNSATPVSKAQEASYHASLRIAKAGKMCGEKAAKLLDLVPLSNDVKWTHCSMHRGEALAVNKMPDLKSALDSAVKVVNFIKAWPINSRLFSVPCNEMGSEHVQLLLHSEVRWLSRSKGSMNMGLQGLSLTIFDRKLQLFVNKIKAGNVSAFPTLENYLHTYGVVFNAAVCDVIVVQLLSLEGQFSEYFPVEATPSWIRNTFTVDVTGIPEDLSDYPALSLKAVWFLMPFATTYLCEKGFSAPTAIKTKYCNKMNAEPDLRLKLTALVPDIARLSSAKQAHPSH
ncbi:ZBED5 protein, partial [Amia calva]|nr:ZBED5 protein [Amia calva]